MDYTAIIRYLFLFDHQAIREIAADAWSPLWALLLVLSAGVARNHARHDLIARPWRALTPIVASLLTAAALLLFIQFSLWIHAATTVPWISGFWCLLGLYWATAPLAWIYGIPFEWLLGFNRAEQGRLISLGIVAAWRVALMFNVLYVFLDRNALAALAILLLVESAIVLLAHVFLFSRSEASVRPTISSTLIEAMGGIMLGPQTSAELNAGKWDFEKLSDSPPPFRSRERTERVASAVASICIFATTIGLIPNFWISPKAATWSGIQPSFGHDARGAWYFSTVSLLLWVTIALFSQPAQRRKSHVLQLFKRRDLHSAIRYMAERPASAFPAAWEPPPSEDFRGTPSLLEIMEVLATIKPGAWLQASYAPRIRHYVAHAAWYWHYSGDVSRLCDVLERLPAGAELARLALAGIDRHKEVLDTCRSLHERSKSEEQPSAAHGHAVSEPFRVFPPASIDPTEQAILYRRLQTIARL